MPITLPNGPTIRSVATRILKLPDGSCDAMICECAVCTFPDKPARRANSCAFFELAAKQESEI